MIKITSPDTHVGLLKSGHQLVSYIPQGGLTKSASEVFMRDKIAEFKPDDNHWMQHLIAMGAHERYGWNRNSDTFTRDELMKTHDTFTKYAHLYREHRNTCPTTLGIGTVKASAYNPKMDWVELIVHGDKRKTEQEYEMAKAGKELSYSMSCKIAGDVCSCCNKFSRRTTDYCDHAANQLGQFVPEFNKYAFVYNPNPRFFDISIVGKPADRLAHYIEYRFSDDQQKAASEGGRVIGGAAWAEFYGMGDDSNLRTMLTRIDEEVDSFSKLAAFTGANSYTAKAALTSRQMGMLRLRSLPTVFRALAKRASLLPFDAFVSLVSGQDIDVVRRNEDYSNALTALHMGQLKSACDASLDLESHVSGGDCGEDPDPVDAVLDEVDGGLACKVQKGEARMRLATSKIANAEAQSWAAVYGVYKAAALREMLECGSINESDVSILALRF